MEQKTANSEAQETDSQTENLSENDVQNVSADTQTDSQTRSSDNVSEEKSDNMTEESTSEGENSAPKEENFEEKYNELNDRYLRLMAEFDNYRKRTLKEKMELTKNGGEDVLKGILPVVDNMERAMKSMETATDTEAVKEGINLIYKKFQEFLTGKGLKEIEAQGLDLDTDKHEAVTKFPAPSEDLKGKIIDVIEKGYTLNDKVIRYAKVVIGE
ncbi:MAG: nucleotide exchange factor GrpE [Bacteroidales bacterium]|nr:nucleotide exchange factor GrpE [Bacteroidales bacterium]